MKKNLTNEEVYELCSTFSSYLGLAEIESDDVKGKVSNILVAIAKHFIEKKDTESLVQLFANVIHNHEKTADIKIITDDNDRSIGVFFNKEGEASAIGTKNCRDALMDKIKDFIDCKGDC